MKMLVFSVFDLKTGCFAQPFFGVARGQALRSFGDAVQGGDGVISKHPGDYQLFEIGGFDDEAGRLEACIPAQFLASGGDFVVPVPETRQIREVK